MESEEVPTLVEHLFFLPDVLFLRLSAEKDSTEVVK